MYIIPEIILVTEPVAAILQLQTTLIHQTKYNVLKITWMAWKIIQDGR